MVKQYKCLQKTKEKNRRLDFIKSLHIQQCKLRGDIRPLHWLKQYSNFKVTRMRPMVPKETKYSMHYGEVRGDFTAAARHFIPVAVK